MITDSCLCCYKIITNFEMKFNYMKFRCINSFSSISSRVPEMLLPLQQSDRLERSLANHFVTSLRKSVVYSMPFQIQVLQLAQQFQVLSNFSEVSQSEIFKIR